MDMKKHMLGMNDTNKQTSIFISYGWVGWWGWGGGVGGEEITLENAIGKTHYQVTEWCIPRWNRPYWACSIRQWPLPKCDY